jgi:SAM-dependent methyltransferase
MAMSSGEKFQAEAVNAESRRQYEYGPDPSNARRRLYLEYADPPFNIWEESIKQILPQPAEARWLDVATGDGIVLDIAHNQFGHQGLMLGIDNQPRTFINSWQNLQQNDRLHKIEFQPGNAERIQFEDNYFQVLTNFFGAYHHGDTTAALNEAKRVVEPGGKEIWATRDDANQKEIWQYGETVADKVGIKAPTSPYWNFNIPAAEHVLSSMFRIDNRIEQTNWPLRVPMDKNTPGDRLGWEDVRWAVFSLWGSLFFRQRIQLSPEERRLKSAIEGVVDTTIWRLFSEEVEREGCFTITAHQATWECTNLK